MTLSIVRDGAVAVVTVDNPPVNALSRSLRAALLEAAETLDAAGVAAVVLTGAGRTFIAGADVGEFDRPPEPPHLPDVVARIEGARVPWVAAINGAALGGGFEVALGCRARITLAAAVVGLPEVTLGVIPGAGGTVRLPRLVPLATAVDLVTSGRTVAAAEAAALGLVDRVVDGDLRAAAVAFAANLPPLPPPLRERPAPVADEAFWRAADATARKAARGETAPLRALGSLRRATQVPFADAMAFERDAFLALRASHEAAALRHVVFAERAAVRPGARAGVAARPVRTAAVVGGGTMGAGIAAALAQAEFPVALLETDADALARGLGSVRAIFEGAATRGRLSEAEAATRIARVRGVADAGELGDADLVVEAVFEDLAVKRAVFEALGRACRPDAILATNTSYLDPRAIAAALPAPERFVGLHFFSPANVMRLLEIVPIPETSPATLAAAFAVAKRLGKIPVQAGICDGFIGNRILRRYRAAAEALVRRGIAVGDVDAAMRAFGFPMGPFEAQDLGGLDIAFRQREAARARGESVPEALADILVRAGRKGQKTGGGWYDYDGRAPRPSATVAALLAPHIAGAPPPGDIAEHLVAEMAAEGDAILADGVARAAADIDLVEIHGYGFPRRKGGPMFHARHR